MSFNPDGTATCDYCSKSAGNGGVLDAVAIADVNFSTGESVVYHLCRSSTNSPMCCDRALSLIPAAAGYLHSGPSTDDAGTG